MGAYGSFIQTPSRLSGRDTGLGTHTQGIKPVPICCGAFPVMALAVVERSQWRAGVHSALGPSGGRAFTVLSAVLPRMDAHPSHTALASDSAA